MAFCPNCGTQLTEGSHFCPSCGTPLDVAPEPSRPPVPQGAQQGGVPPTPSDVQVPARGPYADSSAADPSYQKLGGWLLFFVVMWGLSGLSELGTILSSMGQLGRYFSYGFGASLVLPTLLGIVASAFAVAVATIMIVFVVQRNQTFLRLYQILEIAEIVLAVLTNAVASGSGAGMAGAAAGGAVGGALGLWLMTMYFCKSKRVRAYMGSTAYIDQALFKVGID